MVNIPLLILPCLFLFLIINPTMQMKIIHSPNIPPTTEATAIAIGAESVAELNVVFIVIILVAIGAESVVELTAVFIVIVLVGVVRSWIFVLG